MTLKKDYLKEHLYNKYCKGKKVLPIILISVFSPFAVYTCGYSLINLLFYLFTLNFFQVLAFFMMLVLYFILFGSPVVLGIILLKKYKNKKEKIENECFVIRHAECISVTKTGNNKYVVIFNNGQKCKTSFDVFSSTSIGDHFYMIYIEGIDKVAELFQVSKYNLSEELEQIIVR